MIMTMLIILLFFGFLQQKRNLTTCHKSTIERDIYLFCTEPKLQLQTHKKAKLETHITTGATARLPLILTWNSETKTETKTHSSLFIYYIYVLVFTIRKLNNKNHAPTAAATA